jgi:hypothetical protein
MRMPAWEESQFYYEAGIGLPVPNVANNRQTERTSELINDVDLCKRTDASPFSLLAEDHYKYTLTLL